MRSFVGSSQLISHDGELLMHISDMRCVAYEAAVPQRASKPAELQPFSEMSWRLDIDSLTPLNQPRGLSIADVIVLIAHKNPQAKVLELGCEFAADALAKVKLLDYTAVVALDEIEKTEAVLSEYRNAKVVKYEDIAVGTYDLVVALNVSPKSIHHFLVAGGRAVLANNFGSPSPELQALDFTGIDFMVHSHTGNVLVTSTVPGAHPNGHAGKSDNKLTLIKRNKTGGALLFELETTLARFGWVTKTVTLSEHEASVAESVVMLDDPECALLASIDDNEFEKLKILVSKASSIFWLTSGGLISEGTPQYAMVQGLARSVNAEQASLDFTTLDYDSGNTSSEAVVNAVTALLERQLTKSAAHESEYYLSEGLTYISRLVSNDTLNQAYALKDTVTRSTPFVAGEPLTGKVEVGKVVFQADDQIKSPPMDEEVEVQVEYSGLNKEAVMVINGTDYPQTFSHEICGTVTRVGAQVNHLKPGDKVFGFNLDHFATIQKAKASLVMKIDSSETSEELAGLPMAYAAAIYGLEDLAKVEAGEKVLILHGTGIPGLAAIKLSQTLGAKTYVTVATAAEAEGVSDITGLPTEYIFVPTTSSMSEQIRARMGCHGIDVIFGSASANNALASECWRNIAPFGRFIQMGRKNVLKRTALDTMSLHQSATYHAFDLLSLFKLKPRVLSNLLQRILSRYKNGSITGFKSVTVRHLAELDQAISSFSDSFSNPKTLISYGATRKTLEVLPTRTQMTFHPDATYLLVGALGGLGRSLTAWMSEKGARRFAFLSRSGTDSAQAKYLVDRLEQAGNICQVIRGDVTIQADVERAVQSIPAEYPIRGVVQAAMVLRVSSTIIARTHALTL